MKKETLAGTARRALSADNKMRKAAQNATLKKTADSMQNFAAALGIGTDNLSSYTTYGFNPISRVRTLLEWIHRGSWLGGVAVDLVADDMTRAGININGELEPDQIQELEEEAVTLGIWNSINDAIKWARLYGGCIAVMLIEGQDMSTPMRLETVGKDQFKGLLVLDRWMVDPSLNDLVQDLGPSLGLPKYYRVTTDAPAYIGKKIHYSRVIRLEGIRLPYWQRVMENLWGISVIERLYDRMVAFDSATTGAAQLVYKAFLRTYKIKGLAEAISSGGVFLNSVIKQVQFMRQQQSIEGITVIDSEDEFESTSHAAFSGLSDALLQFGQQLAGALQIPLVRLFGQSPAGLNSSGESDLRTYYDGINQQQVRYLLVGMTKIYRLMAQSLGMKVPKGFGISFKPLWQLTEPEKAEIAERITNTVIAARDAGLISDQSALKEFKQSSSITGIWTNLTDEAINAASDTPAPPVSDLMPGEGAPGDPEGKDKVADDKISQAKAGYVPKSKKVTYCGICSHFNPAGSCSIVAGEISANGGCNFFMPKDPI